MKMEINPLNLDVMAILFTSTTVIKALNNGIVYGKFTMARFIKFHNAVTQKTTSTNLYLSLYLPKNDDNMKPELYINIWLPVFSLLS